MIYVIQMKPFNQQCQVLLFGTKQSLSCAGHVLRRFDLSYMTHHSPLPWGKVAMEKMSVINTSGPVLINGQCICYMLVDHS